MSLFSSIAKIGKSIFSTAKSLLPTAVGYAVGGPVGGAIGGMIGGGKGAPPVVSGGGSGALVPLGSRTGGIMPTLPGAGRIGAGLAGAAIGAAGASAVGTLMSDGSVRRRRRRRRGISAAELKNHARVERFLQSNFKCKSGGTRGTYLRRKSR